MTNKTITIVGTGLLGGSYAMALTQAGNTVYGIDINKESIDFAIENNYIKDGAVENYEDFLKKSDIVVLCLYPSTLINWVKENICHINKNALITDVCGVKQNVVNAVQEITKPYGVEFYSAHPMRGKEVLGIKNADSKIFTDGNFILTPTAENSQTAKELITDMAKTLGFSTISTLSLREHDEMVGYLSQLTHAIAVSLMTTNDNMNLSSYSGDSFRDLTRIAKIDEHLWSELFSLNKDILCQNIDSFIDNLSKLREYINQDDLYSMKEMFRLSTKRRTHFDKKV